MNSQQDQSQDNAIADAEAAGKASAEAELLKTDRPIFIMDEMWSDVTHIAFAKGWNMVWAGEENRRRAKSVPEVKGNL